jgi:hypothetical protein
MIGQNTAIAPLKYEICSSKGTWWRPPTFVTATPRGAITRKFISYYRIKFLLAGISMKLINPKKAVTSEVINSIYVF